MGDGGGVAAARLAARRLRRSLYGATAVVTGGVFLREAHLLLGRVRAGGEVAPMRLFHWSITYLALLFLAVAVDQLV